MIILSYLYAHAEQLLCFVQISLYEIKTIAVKAYRNQKLSPAPQAMRGRNQR